MYLQVRGEGGGGEGDQRVLDGLRVGPKPGRFLLPRFAGARVRVLSISLTPEALSHRISCRVYADAGRAGRVYLPVPTSSS